MLEKPTVKIVHRLPNRVRVKFSKSLKNNYTFCKMIKENSIHTKIRYNHIINTLLVKFDPSEVLLQEVIYKICTAYSVENGMVPIKLIEEKKETYLNNLSLYSGSLVMLSSLHKLLNRNAIAMQETVNWFTMGVTTLAIADHAFMEVKKKGVFDLEIIPAFYFIKNFIKNPSISIVALMWFTTFGRHLVVNYQGVKAIKVLRIKNPKGDKYYYIANIKDDEQISNVSELIYHVFKNKSKTKPVLEEKYIMKI
jgi:hypothetical protein